MNKLTTKIVALLYCICIPNSTFALGQFGDWTCSVALSGYTSSETGKEPNAYLWIPDSTTCVRFAIMAQQNMTEEALLRNPSFRKKMKELKGALIWVAPWFSQNWDPRSGCQQTFEDMLVGLAGQSGHKEITDIPIVPFGHSAQATFPWNFAAWNNDKTLCIVSFHGDAPRTNLCGYGTSNIEWGRTRNIDGIPGLMIIGEYEWWQARIRPAQSFRMMYPEACISFLCDAGSGHFDLSEQTINYIALFIEKACENRLQSDGTLKRLNPHDGWLYGCPEGSGSEGSDIESFPTIPPNSWNKYKGDKHTAFWYFDEEMALITARRYKETNGRKKISMPNKELDLRHMDIGDTFTIQQGEEVLYICGPVRKIDKRSFEIIPYDCGLDNPKRSHSAWVVAVTECNDKNKRIVQPIHIELK